MINGWKAWGKVLKLYEHVDHKIIHAIKQQRIVRGRYPSLSEISEQLGFSRTLIYHHINAMSKVGTITKDNRGRIIGVGKIVERPKDIYALTAKELEIAELLTKGMKKPFICQKLGISINTLNNHLCHMYRKADVLNRTQLVYEYIKMKARKEATE